MLGFLKLHGPKGCCKGCCACPSIALSRPNINPNPVSLNQSNSSSFYPKAVTRLRTTNLFLTPTNHIPYPMPYHIPYTLYPIPYNLNPVPCTLHPATYALHPIPHTQTLYPELYTLYPMPCSVYPILHPIRYPTPYAYALCPVPCTLYPMPYTLCPVPYALCPLSCTPDPHPQIPTFSRVRGVNNLWGYNPRVRVSECE